MNIHFIRSATERYRALKIRGKFALAFGAVFLFLGVFSATIVISRIQYFTEFRSQNLIQGQLTELADDIRYYDATLTDAVRAYLIDPEDQGAYDRYYADAAALDQAIQQAKQLATSETDRMLFDEIDRVNLELVAIEESLLADPSIETAVELYRGRYGELKAEYASYVQTFAERQRVLLDDGQAGLVRIIQQTFVVILGVAFVLLVLLTALSAALSRYFITRIEALKTVTEQFAQGDLGKRIPVTSQDELGDLAVAFNTMAAQQQEQIRQIDLARREAVEATRMKDLFLATMSHELRTPLNAMIGFLHLMIYSGQMDDDNEHMAERALANTQRLLTLINNILDLSRIATGGLEIVPGEMRLPYVASGLYNDLKNMATDKDLRLELDVDPKLPETINHDEARISQIVTNLVSNAIKFTESGTVRLSFRGSDDRLIIQVSDTGIGIPQSKQHLIFDDFFQVDGTSTRHQQGAGLGLAIVKRLVLLMNGSIKLTSEVDKGSTFTIDLPLNLPRYEPGARRKQAEHVFVSSMKTPTLESSTAQPGAAKA